MNILLVIAVPSKNKFDKIGTNGPERRAANIIDKWKEYGVKPIICYPKRGLLWNNFSSSAMTIDYEIKNKFNIIAIYRFYTLIKKYKIQLIHTQGPPSLDILAILCSKIIKIPVIVTRPVMINEYPNISTIRKKIYFIIDYLFLKKAEKVVAISNAGLDYLKKYNKISESKLALVYNGIDCNKFNKNPLLNSNSTISIGMVASLFNHKGWNDFIDVINCLIKEGLKVNAFIIGTGPIEYKLKERVLELGLTDTIKFLGHINNIETTLKYIDIFLFTSYCEGLSVAVIEALATGLPIVATEIAGIHDQVIHNYNGYLVKPGDILNMKNYCIELLDIEKRIQFGNRSKEIAKEKFSEDKMIENYYNIYSGLLNSSGIDISN